MMGGRFGMVLGGEVVARRDDLADLVQHEYVHVCRTSMCEAWAALAGCPIQEVLGRVTVAEVLVQEGLATLGPAYVGGRGVAGELLGRLLFWTPDQLATGMAREGELRERIMGRLGEPAYGAEGFTGGTGLVHDDGSPTRYGYFVGARMIVDLVSAHGWELYPRLVSLPAERVLDLWRELDC